jgi:hypothetical protein
VTKADEHAFCDAAHWYFLNKAGQIHALSVSVLESPLHRNDRFMLFVKPAFVVPQRGSFSGENPGQP